MIAVATTVLVIDAIWKSVSASTGSGWSTLVTPNPATRVSSPSTTPSATPGTR
jgi:hypothetical protein